MKTIQPPCDLENNKTSIQNKGNNLKKTINSTVESVINILKHLYTFPPPNRSKMQLEAEIL